MTLRSLWLRLRALALNRQAERELDEELAFHLEKDRRRLLGTCVSGPLAARKARARFGSLAYVKDRCRDAGQFVWVESIAQDVRIALRGLRRSPGYALTIPGTIAIGLGLNIATFTIFNAYALRADLVQDPSSLYEFTWTSAQGRRNVFSWSEYQALSRANPVFSQVFARRSMVPVRLDGQHAIGQLVTGNYFSMLGVPAALGRPLAPYDLGSDREPVVVLSDSGWHRLFHGDPDVVGKRVTLAGQPCEIVGVAREGFGGLDVMPPDFWAPLTLSGVIDRGPEVLGPDDPDVLSVTGRLRPGVTDTEARTALLGWARAHTADRLEGERARSVVLESRTTAFTSERAGYIGMLVMPLFAGFALVLVLACTNVTGAALARAISRRHEFEIRLALGASRARIVRHVLIESLLLAIPAAAVGLSVATIGIDLAVRLLFETLPAEALSRFRPLSMEPDMRVVTFALSLSVMAAMIAGVVPRSSGSTIWAPQRTPDDREALAVANSESERAGHGVRVFGHLHSRTDPWRDRCSEPRTRI